jgi:pyruvate dehydrogenase phosphatase
MFNLLQYCRKLTNYRDDLTISVIFFGEESGNGNVSLNEEASAAAKAPKPKL